MEWLMFIREADNYVKFPEIIGQIIHFSSSFFNAKLSLNISPGGYEGTTAKGGSRWRFYWTPKSTDLDPKGLQISGHFCTVQEIKKSCNVSVYRILQ